MELLENRLSSNIYYLEVLLRNNGDIVMDEGTPDELYLSQVISDLKDIQNELANNI